MSSFQRVPFADPADYIAAVVDVVAQGEIVTRRRLAVTRLIESRIVRLAAYLANGDLSVRGTCPSRSIPVGIPAELWKRGNTFVDFTNGDLYESAKADGQIGDFTLLVGRLTLHRPDAIGRDLASLFENDAPEAKKRRTTTVGADTACEGWLKEQIEGNPKGKPQTRDTYKAMALEKWPGLAGRGFDRAWAAATKGTSWAEPGRPRKSPH